LNFIEQIFNRRARGAKPEWFADLFERLGWMMDDEGAEIHATMRRWIESGDLARARVALGFTDVFLYQTRSEMVTAFDQLCTRFPELRSRCDEIVAQWDAQPGHA